MPDRLVIADRGDAGCRLDLVVRRHLADLGRATCTRVQSWIEDGRVSVNDRIVTRVASRVTAGDAVTVRLLDADVPVTHPENRPIELLFEDEHLLIVSKPAGVVSHPTFRHPGGSLLNALLFHARDWPPGQRPSLVGRLDQQTSGAVIVARSTAAHARLQAALASRASRKEYLAVVHGPMHQRHGGIALRLRRDPDDRRRVVASAHDGAASLTRFERLEMRESPALALVRCELVTGRMHQIRVHLAARQWPIVGDRKYGRPLTSSIDLEPAAAAIAAFPRQALHAWRLSFTHPFIGRQVAVTAPLPPDLAALLAVCGWGRLPVSPDGSPQG